MKKSLPYNEALLLEQFYIGSHDAFTKLYNQYSERLYYNILSMVKDETTAEELVQDIFSDIWQKRDTIRITSSFASYLFMTSRNVVLNFFEKAGRNIQAKV